MVLGPSDKEEKERIRIANKEKLDELTKSLRNAKKKFNFKKCT